MSSKMYFMLISCLLTGAMVFAQGKKRKDNNLVQNYPCDSSSDFSKNICQNFKSAVLKKMNTQIRDELEASYFYQDLGFHFARVDVALHGFAKFFRKASDEERQHAEKLMTYINKRGGKIHLHEIRKQTAKTKDVYNKKTSLEQAFHAVKTSIDVEKDVNTALLNLHVTADKQADFHLSDYLDNEFLTEQVDSLKELGDLLTKLRRFKEDKTDKMDKTASTIGGIGVHMIDQELLK